MSPRSRRKGTNFLPKVQCFALSLWGRCGSDGGGWQEESATRACRGQVWHPARVRGPDTRLPVVVPPLPRTTTGYLLATLRVGFGGNRENVHGFSAMAGT